MERDITIPVVAMLRLGYFPKFVMDELDLMKKLSTFKKDHCIRMLDGLLSFDSEKLKKDYPESLIEKLLQQAIVQSVGMDDRNLTRCLSILRKLLPHQSTIEQKRLVAQRAQIFIDRFVELLRRNGELDYN